MNRPDAGRPARQGGAALLAFVLLLIVGAAYTLLIKINSGQGLYARQQAVTLQALSRAKQALMAYALTYPEAVNPEFAPGYLPCPDRNKDGSANDGPCAFAANSTIGRLPFQTLKITEPRDASGAALWYVLADNFRHNPKLVPLNSETPAGLRLDGAGDEIAALIIAPGAALAGQDRDPNDKNIASEIGHYLEFDNNDLDLNFISAAPVTRAGFNDTLMAITRQELMRMVEGRVLGELAGALSEYRRQHGAYPRLGHFADPKMEAAGLYGRHRGPDNAAVLSDNTRDFTALGVKKDDLVYNLSDGSISKVARVAARRRLSFASTVSGRDNDFDTGDEYALFSKDRAALFAGHATAGSRGLMLQDNTRDLAAAGIRPGAVIKNLTDGSSGIISRLRRNRLWVKSLSGGTNNAFANGDRYLIRGNYGLAGPGSAALTLNDSRQDFLLAGLQKGELIWNLDDGSMGRIAALSATQLSVDSLRFGEDNAFTPGDRYFLPRFNAAAGVRQGLPALHAVGEPFQTAIEFDWSFNLNAAAVGFDRRAFPMVQAAYRAAMTRYLGAYARAGRRAFDASVGVCVWFLPSHADCYAAFRDFLSVSGRVTAAPDRALLTDSRAAFISAGITEGALAQNYDHAVRVAAGTVDAASHGTATAGGARLVDVNNDFTRIGAARGDTVYNLTDGSAGQIQSLTPTRITLADLKGGRNNRFAAGDEYRIGARAVLYDAAADFSAYKPYGHVLQNTRATGEKRALVAAVLSGKLLETAAYGGRAAALFRPGDGYEVLRPRRMVVTAVASETQLGTANYRSATAPDFNSGDFYRLLPAARELRDRQVQASHPQGFSDASVDFIALGVKVGDIVKNHAGAYGEISAVSRHRITAQLYGGLRQDFVPGQTYSVFYDHAFERRHVLRARFGGSHASGTAGGGRTRAVCLGYSSDCGSEAAAVPFAANGDVFLITLKDYQEDETTEVGRARFTPSVADSGRLRLRNIAFKLHTAGVDLNGDGDYLDAGELKPELPPWFIKNDWHKLIYIAYAEDLTLLGEGNPNPKRRAVVIAAGAGIERRLDSACRPAPAAPQNRVNGSLNEYFEAANCKPEDNIFQRRPAADTFNDMARGIVEPAP